MGRCNLIRHVLLIFIGDLIFPKQTWRKNGLGSRNRRGVEETDWEETGREEDCGGNIK